MIQHNDAKAPESAYERSLFTAKMPRAYWKHIVENISFLDYQIYRNQVEYKEPELGKKKVGKAVNTLTSRLLFTAQADQQAANWEALRNQVFTWDPQGPRIPSAAAPRVSPENCFSLFCCENLQAAQVAMYTMMHYMIASGFKKQERPYRVETIRTFELFDLCQQQDPQEAPHVVMLPNLISDLPPTQASALSEIFSSSYRVFAATNMSPQAFFDRFGYVPFPCFYINEVELCSREKLLRYLEGK